MDYSFTELLPCLKFINSWAHRYIMYVDLYLTLNNLLKSARLAGNVMGLTYHPRLDSFISYQQQTSVLDLFLVSQWEQ